MDSSSHMATKRNAFLVGGLALLANVAYLSFLGWRKRMDMEKMDKVTIELPIWAKHLAESYAGVEFSSEEDMMRVAIELSAQNVEAKTGGPFGCAIFEKDTHSGVCRLFSTGVNMVVSLNNSTLHGEMVAIQFAQKKLQNFSLKGSPADSKEYHLYTSCEPCAMCLGGTLWSGVSKMVCAATKADAESIGFNEGPVFPQSYSELETAGVQVVRNMLREDAARVLQNYGKVGVIYNG